MKFKFCVNGQIALVAIAFLSEVACTKTCPTLMSSEFANAQKVLKRAAHSDFDALFMKDMKILQAVETNDLSKGYTVIWKDKVKLEHLGLEFGDVVCFINGRHLTSEGFYQLYEDRSKGLPVTAQGLRKGQPFELTLSFD